jgi:hypothetical protein
MPHLFDVPEVREAGGFNALLGLSLARAVDSEDQSQVAGSVKG